MPLGPLPSRLASARSFLPIPLALPASHRRPLTRLLPPTALRPPPPLTRATNAPPPRPAQASKFNRESSNPRYFTLRRLRSVAQQCLRALAFIHRLGLIHCDLKPENILIKSYSRCEVTVIDFGSSCFTTDHLSS